MPYSSIDPTIRAWTERHGLTLFTHVEGNAAQTFRGIYISNLRGECCQIWLDPPQDNRVAIHAAGVETQLDVEMQRYWQVPVSDLDNALEDILSRVKRWLDR